MQNIQLVALIFNFNVIKTIFRLGKHMLYFRSTSYYVYLRLEISFLSIIVRRIDIVWITYHMVLKVCSTGIVNTLYYNIMYTFCTATIQLLCTSPHGNTLWYGSDILYEYWDITNLAIVNYLGNLQNSSLYESFQ